ncbi:MAG TPA: metallophosphoesterase, partial [Elusimicrobiales bacterium]|nr:metallophosphoesterase [Elusimicrobiales bacterium]
MRKFRFLLAFLLFPPAARAAELQATGVSVPEAAAGECAKASTQTVTLVHVTDMHARYQPGPDGISPYARIRGYFETVRAENPGALLLDGGDAHEKGSLAEILSSGTATNEVTRALRFDVRVLGNHDFAWGEAVARDNMRDPSGAVLGSNLTAVRRSTAPVPAVFMVRQVGCVRVGFFGFVPMPWNEADETYPGDFPGFRADHNYAAAARQLLQNYAGEADLVVMLSHLGNADDLLVAERTAGIDLVLGGHTHDWTWTPKKAGTAVVTETGPYAEFVTRVDIAFDVKARRVIRIGHELRRVGPGMPADPGVQAAIGGILRRYAPEAGRPVTCALQAGTPQSAAAAAARAVTELGLADAAVADSRTVWKPWPAGALSAQNFLDAFS